MLTPTTYPPPQSQRQPTGPAERWGNDFRCILRICEVTWEEDLLAIYNTVSPLNKERPQAAMEASHSVTEEILHFHTPRISHSIAFMVLALVFHSEDPDGVGDAVNVFLFPDLYSAAGSEAALLTKWWDTVFGGGTLTSFSDSSLLLGR